MTPGCHLSISLKLCHASKLATFTKIILSFHLNIGLNIHITNTKSHQCVPEAFTSVGGVFIFLIEASVV